MLVDTGRLTAISVHDGYIRAGAGALTDKISMRPIDLHDAAVNEARFYQNSIFRLISNGSKILSDPHLPNCIAHQNVSFYAMRLKNSGRNASYVTNLISTLDPHQRISYWKSWRTQASDGECAAAKLWGGPEPPRSPNCIRHDITRKDIQLALHRKTQALCPGFDYKDMIGSNKLCKKQKLYYM